MAGRKQGSYSQAMRLLRLLAFLQAQHYGCTIAQLAAEFGVTERQIRRDLDALEAAGHPTEVVANGERRRRVVGKPRGIVLTTREKYALLAARRVFDVLEG